MDSESSSGADVDSESDICMGVTSGISVGTMVISGADVGRTSGRGMETETTTLSEGWARTCLERGAETYLEHGIKTKMDLDLCVDLGMEFPVIPRHPHENHEEG